METGQIIGALFMALIALWWFIGHSKGRWHKSVQSMAIWALIFVGAIAAAGLWEDIQDDVRPRQAVFADQGRVEIPRSFDGHYYMTLDVNGVPVKFVVDTGASQIVLTQEDAQRVGMNISQLRFLGRANTANGEVRTARVTLDEVEVSGIQDRNLSAYVNEGELFGSLLGMSYLQRWNSIQITDGKLILERE